jgi:hypothetical protein
MYQTAVRDDTLTFLAQRSYEVTESPKTEHMAHYRQPVRPPRGPFYRLGIQRFYALLQLALLPLIAFQLRDSPTIIIPQHSAGTRVSSPTSLTHLPHSEVCCT